MPGVLTRHMMAYYLSAVVFIMMATFVPQAQPFILNEVLKIPQNQQGRVAGDVGTIAEFVIVIMLGLYGAISDKIGRRPIYAVGFLIIAISVFLQPYATGYNDYLLYRIIYALGAAAATGMLATVIADYAIDKDRGKASGLQGISNGLGAIITVFLLLRLPSIFKNSGIDTIVAGQMTYLIAGGISLITAVVMWLFLKKGRATASEEEHNLLALIRGGISAAKDPGIALAYAAAFVSRGDLAVMGTFSTLWISNYATGSLNMDPTTALSRAGIIVGVSNMASMLGAPIIGLICDRVNRVNALIFAVLTAGIGYLSTFLVSDPLGPMMFVSVVLIGLGEVFGVIASGVLIAQQSPRANRGTIIGFFSLVGTIGIIIANKVGGYLFDTWRPAAPFILFGAFSLVVAMWGVAVRKRVVPPKI